MYPIDVPYILGTGGFTTTPPHRIELRTLGRIALRLAEGSDVEEIVHQPKRLALLVYLAVAPKSNAVYVAYNEARARVRKDGTRPVPLHLRNAPTRLMKDLGYGKEYRYAHDQEGGFAAGET